MAWAPPGKVSSPGFAVEHAGKSDFKLALELRRILAGLNHQHLPFELRAVLATSACRPRMAMPSCTAGSGISFSKKPKIIAQRAVVSFQLLDSAPASFSCAAFSVVNSGVRRVGDRLRLVALVLTVAVRRAGRSAAVCSCQFLSWRRGPARQCPCQTQTPTGQWPRKTPAQWPAATQRNGQGKALRTAMRGALMVKRRRSKRSA